MPLMVALLFLPAVFTSFFPGKIIAVSFVSFAIISFLLIQNRKAFNYEDFNARQTFYLFLSFNVITLLRGVPNIQDSTDVHVLLSNDIFVYLLYPFFLYFADLDLLLKVWKSLCTIGIIGCLITLIKPPTDGMMSFAHNLTFLHLFFLCTPFIHRKYLYLFLSIASFAVLWNLDRRSILVNYSMLVGILLFYRFLWHAHLRKLIFWCSAVTPLVLLVLGLTGVFNVFKYVERLNVGIETTAERKFNVDSRTGIYTDVFGELTSQNKLVFGLGARGKTATSLSNDENHDYWIIYKNGRSQTESGMLNYFQYGGFVGYLVYTMFFLTCAYFALFRSKNDFLKLIGIFLCFKYFYSFIEDQVSNNLATFYLYLLFGISLNKNFLNMTNKDVRHYLGSFFKSDFHLIRW